MGEARRRPCCTPAVGGGNWEIIIITIFYRLRSRGTQQSLSERKKWEPAVRETKHGSGLCRLNWRGVFVHLGGDLKQYEQIQTPKKWLKRVPESSERCRCLGTGGHVESWCVKPGRSLSPLLPLVGLWRLVGVALKMKVPVAVGLMSRAARQRISHPGSQLCSFRLYFLPLAILSIQSTRRAGPPMLCNACWVDVV